MSKKIVLFFLVLICVMSSGALLVANAQEEIAGDEKITLTVPSMKTEKDELVRFVEEKFNVEYEFIPVSWNDWAEKTRLWVASGDMPDILWWDFKYSEYVNWVNQGVLRPFPSDLSKYPSLEARMAEMESKDALMVDGKQYAWTASRGSASTNNLSTCGLFYRIDWAEDLGLFKEEYTWDEFKDLLTAFVEQDPGNNGAGKTIGIGTVGWGFPRFITEHIQTRQYYYEEDEEIKWYAEQDDFISAVREMKEMYDEGLIWQDQVIAKSSDAKERFLAGEMGVYYDNFAPRPLKQLRNDFIKANPDKERTDIGFLNVINPEGNIYGWKTEDYWSASHFPATLSDEKMERILTIWDWMNSEEGMNYQHRGMKGIDWDEKDGEIVVMNTDIGHYNTEIFRQTVLVARDYSITDNPTMPQEDMTNIREYLERRMESDADIEPKNYEIDFCSTPTKDQFGTMSADVSDQIKYILLNAKDADEAEELFRRWLKEIEPRVDQVLTEMNEALF